MTTSAWVISPSSRTSGLVNAACAGPRRPSTTISLTPDSARTSIAWSAVSVLLELGAGKGEHPGDVGGDVAVADHDGALVGEVELAVGEVRVGVVPVDELSGRPAAGQVLAGDPELVVGRRAVGEDDAVVALAQLVDADVLAHLDVPKKRKPSPRGGLLVDADDRLDLGVVGSDACPHEPEGRRQLVEHVHFDDRSPRASSGARPCRSPPGPSRRSRHEADSLGCPVRSR